MHYILYYTILHYNLLHYTILYYTILYYTILYYTILYYTILYYTILYYTILYYTILYYTIPYHTILYVCLCFSCVCGCRFPTHSPELMDAEQKVIGAQRRGNNLVGKSTNEGPHFGSPYNKDHNIFGSTLGPPIYGSPHSRGAIASILLRQGSYKLLIHPQASLL